jgi:hypothetical protein
MTLITDAAFDLDKVPPTSPLYMMLTAKDRGWIGTKKLHYHPDVIEQVKLYIETGVIHPQGTDELADALCYLLGLHRPDHFPIEYWFAVLMENWILQRWSEGDVQTNDKWLIDVTDLIHDGYKHDKTVENSQDYVIAGDYVLSLIDPDVVSFDVKVFYTGDVTDFTASDELTSALVNESWRDRGEYGYWQYNDGESIRYTYCQQGVCDEDYTTVGDRLFRFKRDSDDIYTRNAQWSIRRSNPAYEFVMKKYPSPIHILVSFDVDCCKVCLINNRIYASPCGYYAIMNKTIKLSNVSANFNSFFRTLKYNQGSDYTVLGCGNEDIPGARIRYTEGNTSSDSKKMLLDLTTHMDYTFDWTCEVMRNTLYEGKKFYTASSDIDLPEMKVCETDELTIMIRKIYGRYAVIFSPRLRTFDDIITEVRECHNLDAPTLEIINAYNWLIVDALPQKAVDFTWYSHY